MADTSVESLFGIKYPILGLTGLGWSSPSLTAAISEAGGLGVLPVGFMTEAEIRAAVQEVRTLTNKPFAVSLFAPKDSLLDTNLLKLQDASLKPLREQLGLSANRPLIAPDFDSQFRTLIDLKVPVIGLWLGGLREPYMEELKKLGIKTFGVASNIRDGKVLVSSGVDAVVAAGWDNGGLLSCCEVPSNQAKVDSSILLTELTRALKIPVIAAGSLLLEQQVRTVKTIGAKGLALSDALLFSDEAKLPESWITQLSYTSDSATVDSELFTGKSCRALYNGMIKALEDNNVPKLDFPYQYLALRDIYEQSKSQQRIELSFLDIGQFAYMAQQGKCSHIIDTFAQWFER